MENELHIVDTIEEPRIQEHIHGYRPDVDVRLHSMLLSNMLCNVDVFDIFFIGLQSLWLVVHLDSKL